MTGDIGNPPEAKKSAKTLKKMQKVVDTKKTLMYIITCCGARNKAMQPTNIDN
jgi:hypothetical protein